MTDSSMADDRGMSRQNQGDMDKKNDQGAGNSLQERKQGTDAERTGTQR